MADRAAILAAWARTRWAARIRDRGALARRQARLWQRMAPMLRATPALAAYAGRPLAALPITDVAAIRADFAGWNSRGLTEAAARAAAEAAERGEAALLAHEISAGFSTGSSGTRGLFLTDPQERARYVGQALARLLPASALLAGRRIALCLRADSALYRDVGRAGRFAFHFVPLAASPGARAAALRRIDPQVLIAPPHVLAELADAGIALPALDRLFYGAEPLGEAERGWIAARLGRRPDPIYQATEGFIGATCRMGTLHLNEEEMVVELEPVPGTSRFRPIVTDLGRRTQPIVRVRLDDLVEPLAEPCGCGAATRAIHPVEGRIYDLWRWEGVTICPRDVETVLADALGGGARWRAIAGPAGVSVASDAPDIALPALRALLSAHRIDRPLIAHPFHPELTPKRRRVRWRSDG